MLKVFPSLSAAKITHSWSGNVCFSYDRMTHIGQLACGSYYSTCYNGNGISMATYMGHRVAEMMLGVPGSDRGIANTNFPGIPLYSGRPWFLPIVGSWYKLCDGIGI